MTFLTKNKAYLQFEWNSAGDHDWPKIKRLFVGAYVGAYKSCELDELDLNAELIKQARDNDVDPLTLYFAHEFNGEHAKIKAQCGKDKFNINYLYGLESDNSDIIDNIFKVLDKTCGF